MYIYFRTYSHSKNQIMKKLLSVTVLAVFALACSSNNDPKEEMPSNQVEDSTTLSNPTEESSTSVGEQIQTIPSNTTATAQTVSYSSTTKPTNKPSNVKVNVAPSTTEKKATEATTTNTVVQEEVKKEEPVVKVEPTIVETVVEETVNKPPHPTLSHDIFNDLLSKYVNSSGGVDYDGFKANKTKLAQYLEVLKNNPPESSWSKNKEMAYWINLYNALTIHSIVEKYPVNSIMDLEGGKVWDKKKIEIKGESLTLNMIEKDKLLKKFKEPRVHFAVNCAAASCPPLLNKAWEEDNVQRYFEQQAKAFINNKKYNVLSAKSVEVSQIFNWYASDFGGADKIVAYIQKYSDTTINSSAKVTFKEYDWNLNKK